MEKASRDDVDGRDFDPFGVQYIRDEFYARREENVDAQPSTSRAPNLFDAQYFGELYDAKTESAQETLPLYADERWQNVRQQTSNEDANARPPRRVKNKRADRIVVQEKKKSPARVYTFNDYKDVLRDSDELAEEREMMGAHANYASVVEITDDKLRQSEDLNTERFEEEIMPLDVIDESRTQEEVSEKKKARKKAATTETNSEREERRRALRIRSMGNIEAIKSCLPNYEKMSDDEIVKMLTERVFYNKDGLIAVNKPYGMTVGDENNTYRVSFDRLVPLLKKAIAPGAPIFEPLHRLDMDTTGVLLVATDKDMCIEMRRLWRKRQVVKDYLAITSRRPQPLGGIIDVPLYMTRIRNRQKMMPALEIAKGELLDKRFQAPGSKSKVQEALTTYETLSVSGNFALVKCMAATGVRHQIRVHMTHGANAPILGDHKYSFIFDYRPQKLTVANQKALGVVQTKVRHLPMFLHAYQIRTASPVGDGKFIDVRAPLPRAFRHVMNVLKLTLK